MEFEDILAEVGGYGVFQKRLLYCFLLPITISISWITYNQIFIMSVPDHWCYVPELVKANLSDQQKMMLIRPMETRHQMPSQCKMYTLDYCIDLLELIRNLNSTKSFNDYVLASNTSTKACREGWAYDRTLYDSTASTYWDLVCDKSHYPHLIFTLASIGGAVATPLYGSLSDRFLPESPRWLVSVGRYEESVVILTRIAETNGYSVPTDLITKLNNIIQEKFPVGTTILVFVGNFGCNCVFVVMYQQAAEIYPTPVRALGMGTSATTSCMALICVPYIVYLGTYEQHIPYLIMGGLCLVASVAASFLPETLHYKLPQTIEDGEEFGKQQTYFSCVGLHGSGIKRNDKKADAVVEQQELEPLPTV
ncbi:organic cation transporter 1-like [Limulus polyphemus]|uniref:Organic cation transporter 1-like n=1 Tax=Limulus polyphemus TaxID=6850 RepID=A0ABM1TSH5_LIMPO|nr:organic cation transporter 1-like [Limulus polyphemus]